MPTQPPFLAMNLLDTFRRWLTGTDGSFHMLFFLGVFALVALVVFGWAIVVRKQGHHHSLKPARGRTGDHERKGGLFSRHKHRRKKHRPTNPTLAETGGLPVTRDSKSPPKSLL